MTDRYERIRAALTMGPTRGPWDGDDNSVSRLWSNGTAGIREYIALPDSAEDSEPNPANMHFIAACDPDTIRALLEERDALREALAGLITWIPSADAYRRLGFDPGAPMRALEEARAALKQADGRECGHDFANNQV